MANEELKILLLKSEKDIEEIKILSLKTEKILEENGKIIIQWKCEKEKLNLENKIKEPIKTTKRTKI